MLSRISQLETFCRLDVVGLYYEGSWLDPSYAKFIQNAVAFASVIALSNAAWCMLQVIAMRLNVKLSPDQERQLLESSMVPISDEEDHVLIIETLSAMPAPVASPQLLQPPAVLTSSASGRGNIDHRAGKMQRQLLALSNAKLCAAV